MIVKIKYHKKALSNNMCVFVIALLFFKNQGIAWDSANA